jgi:hypothetical protein
VSKYQQCYYVITLGYSDPVVQAISDAGLFAGFDVTSGAVGLLIKSFAQCNSLKEAKKISEENGGLILKGVRKVL